MSLLACRFGARHVHAVEPADAVHIARAIVAANGLTERITFYQDISTHVTLPERADVIVSDLRGVLPLLQQHIPTLADARRRLLAPGGVLIPQRDTFWMAVVEAPDLYRHLVDPWEKHNYGFDMGAARRLAVHTWGKGRVTPEQCLTEAHCWATLDYTTLDDPNVSAEIVWTPRRAGVAHGLSLWFEATLLDGITFSNAPDEPEMIYGQAFFPFVQPIAIVPGDRLAVAAEARLIGDDYVWRWDTHILDATGGEKAHFRQSSLASAPLTPEALRKRAADYVPVLDLEGELDCFILTAMSNSGRSLASIAPEAATAFRERFASWQDALPRVGELSQKYGR
jgi:protein arginine N-methyltransferase 1